MPRHQAYSNTARPQQARTCHVPPTFEAAIPFNTAAHEPSTLVQGNAASVCARPAHLQLDLRAARYQSPSPDSDSQASHVESGPSTASTSPYNGSSPRTSRSSSATLPSLSGELSDRDTSTITPEQIAIVLRHLTEILDVTPSERASNSKEKHKFDERRRRGQHKKLLKTQEDLCVSMLAHLQDPSTDSYKGGLHPLLVRATMTGNHKKHNTKTAISLAQILQVLHQASRINRLEAEKENMAERVLELENMLNSAHISLPAGKHSSYPSSPTNKRRRSSLVAGGSQRSRNSISDHSSTYSHSDHSRDLAQIHRH